VQMAGIDLLLDVKGDSLSKIFPYTGIPLPPTRPYGLSGHLRKEGEIWSFAEFKGRVGGSDLSGDLRYDGSKPKPDIQVDAVSKKLDFEDLAVDRHFAAGGAARPRAGIAFEPVPIDDKEEDGNTDDQYADQAGERDADPFEGSSHRR